MLTLDYTNCLADRVGSHGLDPDRLALGGDAAQAITANTARLANSRGKGWERWRDLPFDPLRAEHLRAIKTIVDQRKGRFDNLVVLGIGGSALGNIALQSALNSPTYNLLPSTDARGAGVPPASSASSFRPGPRLFVIDNVDPNYFSSILDFCQSQPGTSGGGLKSTLFNVISKSGETAETAAQFMIIRDKLKHALGPAYADNIVAITDPAKGTMRKICDAEKYATLPVPDGVGGRFSVLSPVGLFSAAMCGIDIESLLNGAADMDRRCSSTDIRDNPAAVLAYLLVELGTSTGKPNHVLMPYANQLYLLADWYRQLWAESLGKQYDKNRDEVFAGFTPIKALGATDQHSQIQLYREGPNDKVIGFVEVESFSSPTPSRGAGVPPASPASLSSFDVPIPAGLGVDATKYLEGRSLATLLTAEKRATEYACVESQRPNYTLRFPRVDAYHVGQFIQLWQVATAYAGLMLNIDAYDQPAVELGKQATFGLMGRKGYEDHRKAVESMFAKGRRTV
jgi:glucose-6-phosphate isomerase